MLRFAKVEENDSLFPRPEWANFWIMNAITQYILDSCDSGLNQDSFMDPQAEEDETDALVRAWARAQETASRDAVPESQREGRAGTFLSCVASLCKPPIQRASWSRVESECQYHRILRYCFVTAIDTQ